MPADKLTLGVDIGGTSIKFGLVHPRTFEISQQNSVATPLSGPEAMVSVLQDGIRTFDLEPSATIGIGVPGAMNRDRTLVRNPPNLPGWGEVPLRSMLEAAMPDHRFEVDNDAKVATLAEAKLGAGRGRDHFLMVTLGTGVGGGIWSEGKIFRGETGGAGEFGLTSVVTDGTPLEKLIGQRYLSQRALDRLATSDLESSLRAFLNHGELDPKEIYAAARAGDKFAVEVLSDAGELLGRACANVAKLLDFYVFVVGGGVAEAGDFILAPALASLKANALPHQREAIRMIPAELGNRAGILGAALLALSDSER